MKRVKESELTYNSISKELKDEIAELIARDAATVALEERDILKEDFEETVETFTSFVKAQVAIMAMDDPKTHLKVDSEEMRTLLAKHGYEVID